MELSFYNNADIKLTLEKHSFSSKEIDCCSEEIRRKNDDFYKITETKKHKFLLKNQFERTEISKKYDSIALGKVIVCKSKKGLICLIINTKS